MTLALAPCNTTTRITCIRSARETDLDRIVEMGRRFLASTSYRDVIADNPSQMARLATGLLDHAQGTILVAERVTSPDPLPQVVGMIGLFAFEHPIAGERIAGELFWWVEPAHRGIGLRLLRAAEQWAHDHGATALQMIAPTPDVERLYERLGYARVEVHYQRRFSAPTVEVERVEDRS